VIVLIYSVSLSEQPDKQTAELTRFSQSAGTCSPTKTWLKLVHMRLIRTRG